MSAPLDLDAIGARAEAATPGPWWAWDRGVGWHIALGDPSHVDAHGRPVGYLPEGSRTDIGHAADAEFIAAAREDVPALLAIVDRVDRLHRPFTNSIGHDWCRACHRLYPCPTRNALGGEPR